MDYTRINKAGRKTYSCSKCDKIYFTSTALINHRLAHAGVKPFKCTKCQKCFLLKSTLKVHMLVHTGEKPFGCLVCGKAFGLKKKLVLHSRVHTQEKWYSCSECGRKFVWRSSMLEHYRRHMITEKTVSCRFCHKSFFTVKSFKIHLKSKCDQKLLSEMHSKSIDVHSCKECSKSFALKSHLIKHFESHKPKVKRGLPRTKIRSEQLQCQRANEVISLTGDLVSKVASDVSPQSKLIPERNCEVSVKSEHSQANVQVLKQNKHKSVKKLRCFKCGKIVLGSKALQNHMRSHRSEPYSKANVLKCQKCKHIFLWKSSFDSHTQTGKCVTVINKDVASVINKDESTDMKKATPVLSMIKIFELNATKPTRMKDTLTTKLKKVNEILAEKDQQTIILKDDEPSRPTINRNQGFNYSDTSFYECIDCGRSFLWRSRMVDHLRKHQAIGKLYSCKECKKSFTSTQDLYDHLNIIVRKINGVQKCSVKFDNRSEHFASNFKVDQLEKVGNKSVNDFLAHAERAINHPVSCETDSTDYSNPCIVTACSSKSTRYIVHDTVTKTKYTESVFDHGHSRVKMEQYSDSVSSDLLPKVESSLNSYAKKAENSSVEYNKKFSSEIKVKSEYSWSDVSSSSSFQVPYSVKDNSRQMSGQDHQDEIKLHFPAGNISTKKFLLHKKCHVCKQFYFKTKNDWETHINEHTIQKKEHINEHTIQKKEQTVEQEILPFICRECGRGFKFMYHVKRHQQLLHHK